VRLKSLPIDNTMNTNKGQSTKKDFKPDDTLRVVHGWVASSRTDNQRGPFVLSTAYPRKDYAGSALDSTTLKVAGALDLVVFLSRFASADLSIVSRPGSQRIIDDEERLNAGVALPLCTYK